MSQAQQTQVMHQQQQGGRGGGLLRTLLRPFMPEVAAGLDVASGLLHGDPSAAVGQAAKIIKKNNEGGEKAPQEEGGITPGKVPQVNPITPPDGQAMAMAGEEANPNEPEPDGDQDDFTPEQMQSLQMISQQFPGIDKELQSQPELLDGAGALVSKLSRYYKRQSMQPQQRMA